MSAGPLDIAMASVAEDPSLESPAREVLRKHARLLDQQIALAGNERFRNRIKAARDLSIAIAVTLLILGGISVVWDASHARGVVVEPFSVPPELAAQGLTGQAAAARMLDHVATLDASTRGEALAGLGVRSATAGDLRVEIPKRACRSARPRAGCGERSARSAR